MANAEAPILAALAIVARSFRLELGGSGLSIPWLPFLAIALGGFQSVDPNSAVSLELEQTVARWDYAANGRELGNGGAPSAWAASNEPCEFAEPGRSRRANLRW